ncbi:GNAT family N-acetyltransferase [Nocardioides euryhalodurans]|uniref:GNAT family N-acetyltransferase n=1 Tax=Nocardioides euryhalodurans TaxID=2518370 RepID=A0A4P7GGY6_9ACTN|nr:GNAT family N-acetyltransferase [Nocardioides euryhalodurans]QBR90994.1 GNAT family N-acetyltransferase [Nocardioides euryhalodurans]
MDVESLAFRTDIALLEQTGSVAEDRGTHLVVRTPLEPSFYWGNFLLLPAPPAPGQVDHWVREARREFPGAEHVSIGMDRCEDGATLQPLREAGFRVDTVAAMTTGAVDAGPPLADGTEVRTLVTDADWDQEVDLNLASEPDDPHLTREFLQGRAAANRALVAAGLGHWWGAFVADQLVSSLGIFRAGEGLARYQNVKTHPGFRRRGLAGALVRAAARDALEGLGADTLVMAANPEDEAIRIYRAVGFTEGGLHAEATLLPARD